MKRSGFVKVYTFHQKDGIPITAFDSSATMTRILQTDYSTQISCLYLDEHGVLGFHQAKTAQMMLIVQGKGKVTNDQKYYLDVQQGDVVLWEKDEWHETQSTQELTAIVIEGTHKDASVLTRKNEPYIAKKG